MQQMSNIFLGSSDTSNKSGGAHNSKTNDSKMESNSGLVDNRFTAELEKAGSANNAHTNTQATQVEKFNPLAEDSEPVTELVTADAPQPTEQDDVSQIFAQINLANNFGSSSNNQAAIEQIAVDGETLPLSIVAANDTEAEQDLSDDVIQVLMQQTGLNEQELNQLSPEELAALLKQNPILTGQSELAIEQPLATVGAEDSTAEQQGPNGSVVNGSSINGFAETKAASLEGKSTESKLTESSNLAANSLSANKLATNSLDAKAQSDHLGTDTRDIFGKELGIEAANTASADLDKKNTSSDDAAKAALQLKNADLSVRMTPVQASLEGSLSASSEESNLDIKSFSALQNQQLQQTSANNRQDLPQFHVSLKQAAEQTPPMQQMIQRFSPMMNQQLITMVSNGVQQAEIRLDPPELGQMMVRIQVQGDTTQVQFQVSQHQTRELVEQAMPRLREMLAEQGMQLTDGQVSQGNGGGAQGEGGNGQGKGNSMTDSDEFSAEEMLTRSNLSTSSASGIDYYA